MPEYNIDGSVMTASEAETQRFNSLAKQDEYASGVLRGAALAISIINEYRV